MGLIDLSFIPQVKQVYLGRQFFIKETGWHMTQCCALALFFIP